jgi:hypothetical protein
MQRKTLYLLGLVTLLVFPLPALWALWYFEDISPWKVLAFDSFWSGKTLLGLEFGILYAFIAMLAFENKWIQREISKQQHLIRDLHLNLFDKVFLSFCAGFGEELLFRAGMQHWAGVWITSIVFIAIHGYLNPKKKGIFLYGLILLPFIFTLGYFLEFMGIWFAIAAHFSYDLVLFIQSDEEN